MNTLFFEAPVAPRKHVSLPTTITIHTAFVKESSNGSVGWGAVISGGFEEDRLYGVVEETTTDFRISLISLIAALERTSSTEKITIYTEFEYIYNCIHKRWIWSWKNREWNKADGTPAMNADLWAKVLFLLEFRNYAIVLLSNQAYFKTNQALSCRKMAFQSLGEHEREVLKKNYAISLEQEEFDSFY